MLALLPAPGKTTTPSLGSGPDLNDTPCVSASTWSPPTAFALETTGGGGKEMAALAALVEGKGRVEGETEMSGSVISHSIANMPASGSDKAGKAAWICMPFEPRKAPVRARTLINPPALSRASQAPKFLASSQAERVISTAGSVREGVSRDKGVEGSLSYKGLPPPQPLYTFLAESPLEPPFMGE